MTSPDSQYLAYYIIPRRCPGQCPGFFNLSKRERVFESRTLERVRARSRSKELKVVSYSGMKVVRITGMRCSVCEQRDRSIRVQHQFARLCPQCKSYELLQSIPDVLFHVEYCLNQSPRPSIQHYRMGPTRNIACSLQLPYSRC